MTKTETTVESSIEQLERFTVSHREQIAYGEYATILALIEIAKQLDSLWSLAYEWSKR